jgi:hypothetical protein
VTVVSWPVVFLRAPVSSGLDASWQMALHLWGHQLPGMGPRIDFTYGPLGFLTWPTLWYRDTGTLAWLAVLAITIGVSAVAVTRLRSRLPLWAALLVAIVVVRMLVLLDGEAAAVPFFTLWWASGWAPSTLRRRIVASGCLGLLTAVLALCKFGEGLVLAGVVLLVPFLWDRRPWRELAVVAGTGVVGTVVLWSALTLSPGSLWHYLRSSLALAAGYWAMSKDETSSAWPYVAAPLVAVALLALVALHRDRFRAAVLGLAAVWVGFLEFKHAFLRADASHVATFFAATAVLALSFVWGQSGRRVVAAYAVAAFAVVAAATSTSTYNGRLYVDVIASPQRLFGQMGTLLSSSHQADLRREAMTRLVQRARVPRSLVAEIGQSTVQIDPYLTEVAWGYHLRLRPVPVFQLYSAYTPSLDDTNARALTGSRAPDVILRHLGAEPIDGRLAAWESPAYQLAVVCNYAEVGRTGGWQLLRHTTPRCGTPEKGSTESLNGPVTVPPTPAGSITVATFNLHSGLGERLRRTVFRQVEPMLDVDGVPRKFVLGTAGQFHLLVVPPGAPPGPFGNELLAIGTLQMRGATEHDTVTFWTIPFTGPVSG